MVFEILKIAIALAVPALMLAEGLAVEARQLFYLTSRPGLFARSLLSVLVVVPALAALWVLLLQPQRPMAAALAVAAACPSAPLVLGKIRRAGGHGDYAAGLHLALALCSIVTVPITLALLDRLLGFQASIRPVTVAAQVAPSLLVPFSLGVAARTFTPEFAARVRRPLQLAATGVIAVVAVVLIVAAGRLLLELELRSYLAMAVVFLSALAAGHLLAGGPPAQRTTLALESALRNPGLALLVASLNFGAHAALLVGLPLIIFRGVLAGIYVSRRRKRAAASA